MVNTSVCSDTFFLCQNQKWKLRTVSDEEIELLVAQSTSYSQIVVKLGMSSGTAFTSVKNRIQLLKLDTSHFTGKAWSKGLTSETHPTIARLAKETSLRRKGKPGKPHSKETREKISKSASERSFTNGCVKQSGMKFSIQQRMQTLKFKVHGNCDMQNG